MKPPSPEVLQCLQDCLRDERTAFEYFHDQEHQFERLGWKCLEHKLDCWVEAARKRRHRLIKRIYEYDAIPSPESDSYIVGSAPSHVFADILDFTQSIMECYGKGIQVLMKAEAFGKPLKTLFRNLACNQHVLLECEKIVQQIKTLGGDAEYLSEQMD